MMFLTNKMQIVIHNAVLGRAIRDGYRSEEVPASVGLKAPAAALLERVVHASCMSEAVPTSICQRPKCLPPRRGGLRLLGRASS
jgi:hypothetical protein